MLEKASYLGIMIGLPLSGKSTWAFQQTDYRMVVCPDDYRLALCDREFHPPAEPMIWAAAELSVRAFLKSGHSVLLDATNITASRRRRWVDIAKEFDVGIHAIQMTTSEEECIARAKRDGRPEMVDVITGQAVRFEPVNVIGEGFSSHRLQGR